MTLPVGPVTGRVAPATTAGMLPPLPGVYIEFLLTYFIKAFSVVVRTYKTRAAEIFLRLTLVVLLYTNKFCTICQLFS